MKYIIFLFGFIIAAQNALSQPYDNMPYSGDRVALARKEKEPYLRQLCTNVGISYPPSQVFLRGFKRDRTLEAWVYKPTEFRFVLLKTYINCQLSGVLGPKRYEGDLQVPEGFYFINEFNSQSDYFLSLGIDYPNRSDQILSRYPDKGGDIYIHGSCSSIGCIPIEDDYIKELYILCQGAIQMGQSRIPVHIFPFHMSVDDMRRAKREYCDAPELYRFWENLMPGYLWFENSRMVPNMQVNDDGKYYINYY